MSLLGALGGIAGSVIGGLFGKDQADANRDAQKEFAQHGIRWKVADAKAAGIHPLYALGAQTHSFTPVGAGDYVGALGAAGQDIGRAIDATRTERERKQASLDAFIATQEARARERDNHALDTRMKNLQIQDQEMRNMLTASQLMGMERARVNSPSFPDGSHQAGLPGQVKVVPDEVVSARRGNSGLTAGVHPAFTDVDIGGRKIRLPSAKTAELTEDMGLLKYGLLGSEWYRMGQDAGIIPDIGRSTRSVAEALARFLARARGNLERANSRGINPRDRR